MEWGELWVMASCMSVIRVEMNPHVIRENLKTKIGHRVMVRVYGMRNKNDTFTGMIKDIYPQIFTVEVGTNIKSFSYSELINGEVVLNFI